MNNATADRQLLRVSAVLFTIFVLAVIGGLALGVGAYMAVAPLVLIPPAVYLLARPDLCLMFVSSLTLLVSGALKYFFDFRKFQWGLSALGMAMLLYAVTQALFKSQRNVSDPSGVEETIILWWIVVVFSSVSNVVAISDWMVGLRIYLPVVGVFVYVAYCRPEEKLLRRIIVSMIAIASVQWIFCLYQKVEVVPLRIALQYPGSPWDSIVGSFGGDKFGGGESGSLGVFLSIIIGLVVALRKHGEIRLFSATAVLLGIVGAVAMIESKVVAVMIPMAFLLVFREYVYKSPMRFFSGAILVCASMFGLLAIYYYAYWQNENNLGLIEALYSRFAYSFDPYFQASTSNLGRIKSLIFWSEQHSLFDNPLAFFVGHGLASAVSASSMIGEGAAVQRYGVMLDVTGVSKLLWETGVIGLLLFILIFVISFDRARRLKAHPDLPEWHRAAMSGVEVAMVLMPISIFYEVTVVSSPPMQFMAMFLLGYVAYWWRETKGASRV